jgi:predicted Rossmann-fold nucleotide-binding protein
MSIIYLYIFSFFLLTNNVFSGTNNSDSEKVLYKLFLFFSPEVSLQIANLLDCTTWSGAEPGLMDAVTRGALLAGKPVGGFKIGKEAGEWAASKFHPYLPSENYLTCR